LRFSKLYKSVLSSSLETAVNSAHIYFLLIGNRAEHTFANIAASENLSNIKQAPPKTISFYNAIPGQKAYAAL